MITDDPDTPGPGHWEINFSLFRQRTDHERRTEEPRIDANYGLGRRLQLKLEGPWVALRTDSGRASGLGDATAGVKWRFLGQEHRTISWSVYPQYEFSPSASSRRKGVASDGYALFLPTELTVELGAFEFNVEAGRNFVSVDPSEWVYGLATEASLGKRLELLGEVHGVHPHGEATELVLNGGARAKLTRQVRLMLAVGRAVRGGDDRPRLLVYAGVQLNLPDTFDFDAINRGRQARRGGD
jgi:hypothetical protein